VLRARAIKVLHHAVEILGEIIIDEDRAEARVISVPIAYEK
jgi:hypothetical protein